MEEKEEIFALSSFVLISSTDEQLQELKDQYYFTVKGQLASVTIKSFNSHRKELDMMRYLNNLKPIDMINQFKEVLEVCGLERLIMLLYIANRKGFRRVSKICAAINAVTSYNVDTNEIFIPSTKSIFMAMELVV